MLVSARKRKVHVSAKLGYRFCLDIRAGGKYISTSHMSEPDADKSLKALESLLAKENDSNKALTLFTSGLQRSLVDVKYGLADCFTEEYTFNMKVSK